MARIVQSRPILVSQLILQGLLVAPDHGDGLIRERALSVCTSDVLYMGSLTVVCRLLFVVRDTLAHEGDLPSSYPLWGLGRQRQHFVETLMLLRGLGAKNGAGVRRWKADGRRWGSGDRAGHASAGRATTWNRRPLGTASCEGRWESLKDTGGRIASWSHLGLRCSDRGLRLRARYLILCFLLANALGLLIQKDFAIISRGQLRLAHRCPRDPQALHLPRRPSGVNCHSQRPVRPGRTRKERHASSVLLILVPHEPPGGRPLHLLLQLFIAVDQHLMQLIQIGRCQIRLRRQRLRQHSLLKC